jgi:hypothetical protein
MATLEALAVVLGADEAGWLLDRNPLVEGEVIDLWGFKLDKEDAELARQVLGKMFGAALPEKITRRMKFSVDMRLRGV